MVGPLRPDRYIQVGIAAGEIGLDVEPVPLAKVVAQTGAFAGVVAGFWHIMWIAGAATLTAGIVGVAVHSATYWRLERDQAPTPSPAEPGRTPYTGELLTTSTGGRRPGVRSTPGSRGRPRSPAG